MSATDVDTTCNERVVVAVLVDGGMVRLRLAPRERFDAPEDRWMDAVDRALAGEGEPASAHEIGLMFFVSRGVALHNLRGAS